MMSSLRLTKDASTAVEDPAFYRSIVGALQYITVTRLVLPDIMWLSSLLSELKVQYLHPVIYSDNLGAVLLAANPVMHTRSKHFELDLHFVRYHFRIISVVLFIFHLTFR
ncbi:hypothetical protein V8G54_026672 [Vigna mungo]|uniref:Uncharacterized protein n=1 Tax=Vigna mungo TaxID=3915 RepID=A0AAQ3RPP5_VIGMU